MNRFMGAGMRRELRSQILQVKQAALDQSPVAGATHQFYRYPARFSPQFARAAIESFTDPGQIVLDPFMGGGTSVIEAYALGRRSIGNDLNSLAVFVASVKASVLTAREQEEVKEWAQVIVPALRCNLPLKHLRGITDKSPRNMSIPVARWLKKTIAQCLEGIESQLSTPKSKRFARSVVLNVGQWALNGRRQVPTADAFRARIGRAADEMLANLDDLKQALAELSTVRHKPIIREGDAENLHLDRAVRRCGPVDLVVTSPPYPGIHMLYHRWQVDGRKETDAPYWIADSMDGAGSSYYNFADRRRQAEDRYFTKALGAFSSIRQVMRKGAMLVQLIAFASPQRQLRLYLKMLDQAGFREAREFGTHRTWRDVPSRRWHAHTKGNLPASREVLLIHYAD